MGCVARAGWMVWMALGLGCGAPSTWLLIELDVGPDVPAPASVELMVIADDDRELIERRVFRVPEEVELPTTVLLVPQNDPRARFYLVGHAFAEPDASGQPIGSAVMLTGYDEGAGAQYQLLLVEEPR